MNDTMAFLKSKITQWLYYMLIFVLSLIALIFLPMIGSAVGVGLVLPTTAAGWIVFIATKLIVALINILIFHCFICQAKLNVADNEHYKAATAILFDINRKLYKPKSPAQFMRIQYAGKGISIFILSILSVFALSQAILMYDWISLLTYLFTIVMGVIFGIFQMKKTELYWTTEFYDYAMEVKANESLPQSNPQIHSPTVVPETVGLVETELSQPPNDRILPDRGTDLLEPANRHWNFGTCDQPMVVEYICSDIYSVGINSTSDAHTVRDNNAGEKNTSQYKEEK